jgi:hypothetical protein
MRKLLALTVLFASCLVALPMTSAFASTGAGGPTSVTIAGGNPGYTIVGGAPSAFTAVTLNGQDQTTSAGFGALTAIDQSGTGSGWNISMQATQFTVPSGQSHAGDTFPLASLTLAGIGGFTCQSSAYCATATRLSPPSACSLPSGTTLDNGAAVKVEGAAANTGMGTFQQLAADAASYGLSLLVPAYAYATTYASTLTISIAAAPSSGAC